MENRSLSNIGRALSTELRTKPAEMSDHIKAYYLWHIIKHFIESFSWYLASLPGGLYNIVTWYTQSQYCSPGHNTEQSKPVTSLSLLRKI